VDRLSQPFLRKVGRFSASVLTQVKPAIPSNGGLIGFSLICVTFQFLLTPVEAQRLLVAQVPVVVTLLFSLSLGEHGVGDGILTSLAHDLVTATTNSLPLTQGMREPSQRLSAPLISYSFLTPLTKMLSLNKSSSGGKSIPLTMWTSLSSPASFGRTFALPDVTRQDA